MTRIRTKIIGFLATAIIVGAGGCTSNGPQTAENAKPDAKQTAPAVGDEATPPVRTPESAADTSGTAASPPPSSDLADTPPDELNAAHILIMHQDSERMPPGITRTREEALALANTIAVQAQADGADFAELARQHSDGPSGPGGGELGNFYPEQMVPAFTNATLQLEIGEVSAPVETPFGYHIIRRQDVQIIPKASAKHILVMYEGSMRAPPNISRTKEEAETRIGEVLGKLEQGAAFEELAREYSDGPSAPSGGDLGEFPRGVMAPTFDEAVFACEVGKVTGIVETPFGFHIIYRYK